ncbi:MAG: hypothetical protein WDN06_01470 [Asticcacaulis sp.]
MRELIMKMSMSLDGFRQRRENGEIDWVFTTGDDRPDNGRSTP